MSWEAKAMAAKTLTEDHLRSIVTRGKPVSYDEALALIGMVLCASPRTESDATKKKDKPAKKQKPKATPSQESSDMSGYVSSEDGETPWVEVLSVAATDDRLAMAIEQGLVSPVKKEH